MARLEANSAGMDDALLLNSAGELLLQHQRQSAGPPRWCLVDATAQQRLPARGDARQSTGNRAVPGSLDRGNLKPTDQALLINSLVAARFNP